jgi:hypothetical protein
MAEQQTTTESVVENGSNVIPEGKDVADFAALLREENAARIGEEPEPEKPHEQTAKPKPTSKAIDTAALQQAFYAGDVAKIAELIGADPKAAKINDSKWAKYRQRKTEATRNIEAQRAELEKEKASIATEKANIGKATESYNRAQEAIKNEDYAAAIEILTGKDLSAVIDALYADHQNPANREIRRMRREVERQREETQKEQERLRQEQLTTRQQAEKAQYIAELKSTIAAHPAAKPFLDEYGPEFVGLVFGEIESNWRRGVEVTEESAIRTVLRNQLAAYDRGKAFFEGLRESLGQTGSGKPKAVQGNQGARLSPRKPTTSSQGGAGPEKPLNEQEEISYWAKQLKAENASRRAG